jgi:hypothetical protein
VDISNGSKVIAFSNVGLQKFKMAAKMADRFLLSRDIFMPKGMFVAFVISSQYISLHTYRRTDIQTSVDSITQIHNESA